jgi:hypothetical protein
MTFTLEFVGDRAKTRFEKLYVGFIIGGNILHQDKSRTRDDRAKEAGVLRQLKSVSVEAPTSLDLGMRALNGGPGKIQLDAKQYEILKKYVEAAPFPTQDSDDVDDALDWLCSAKGE